MLLLTFAAAILAPLCVQAAVEFTNAKYDGIVAGQPFKLTWKGDGTPVTITLMDGPSEDLAKVSTVASSAVESSYVWTPPSDTKSGTYALQIKQSGSTNYSPQFSIKGADAPSSTSSSSTKSTTTTHKINVAAPTSGYSMPNYAVNMQQPPYPVGNGSAPAANTASPSINPDIYANGSTTAAGTPVATIYMGNGTLVSFTGGAGKIAGQSLMWATSVGALMASLVMVF